MSEIDSTAERLARAERHIEVLQGIVSALSHLTLVRLNALSYYDTPEGSPFKDRNALVLEYEGIIAKTQLEQLKAGLPGAGENAAAGYEVIRQDVERALSLWQGPTRPQN
jgi:hypothetical protein